MTDIVSAIHAKQLEEELMTDNIYKFVPLLKENEYVARPRPGWYTESELRDARTVAALTNAVLLDFGVRTLNQDILAYNNADKKFRRTDNLHVHKIDYCLVKLDGMVCCPFNWKSASAYYLMNDRGDLYPGQTFSQVSAWCNWIYQRDMHNSGKEEVESYLASKGYVRSNMKARCGKDHSHLDLPRVLHRQFGKMYCCYVLSYPTCKKCEVETYHLSAGAAAAQETQSQKAPEEIQMQKTNLRVKNQDTAQRLFAFWAAQDWPGFERAIPTLFSSAYTGNLNNGKSTVGHAGIRKAFNELFNIHRGRYYDCALLPDIENNPNKIQGVYKVRYPASSYSCNVTLFFDESGLIVHADYYSKQIQ